MILENLLMENWQFEYVSVHIQEYGLVFFEADFETCGQAKQ